MKFRNVQGRWYYAPSAFGINLLEGYGDRDAYPFFYCDKDKFYCVSPFSGLLEFKTRPHAEEACIAEYAKGALETKYLEQWVSLAGSDHVAESLRIDIRYQKRIRILYDAIDGLVAPLLAPSPVEFRGKSLVEWAKVAVDALRQKSLFLEKWLDLELNAVRDLGEVRGFNPPLERLLVEKAERLGLSG